MVDIKRIFEVSDFNFPYTDLHFPGMNTGEKILFATRESIIILWIRRIVLAVVILTLLLLSVLLLQFLERLLISIWFIYPLLIVTVISAAIGGYWWIGQTYRKSIFIITTRRLTKIIYTTPFTWYQFSLGLDEIADTGSYSSSYFEAILSLGYFVARSGAAAIKNFKIINITFAADLHNYVNKLLYVFKHTPEKVNEFRPFIPHLKGEKRKKFLEAYPHYKTEF